MILFDLCINIVENTIIYFFLVNYLRMNNKYNRIVLTMFIIISTISITFFNLAIGYEGLYIYVLHFIAIIFCFKYSDNYLIECIFIVFLSYSLIAVINGTLIISMNLLISNEFNSPYLLTYKYSWIIIILSKIIFLIVCANIVRVRKKYNDAIIQSEIAILFLLVVLISLAYLPFSNILYAQSISEIYIVIGFFSLSILSVSIVFAFFRLLNINKGIKNNEIKVKVQQSKLDSVTEVSELNNKISGLKHDMKHILSYINNCLENNNIDEAKKLTENYSARIEDLVMVKITNNDILNYTLNQLIAKCKNNNIECISMITSDCKINLEDNDFIIILSNIFDNAYENCCGKNSIRVNISDNGDYSIISVENSIDVEKIDIKKGLRSSKVGELHGYGIKNVCDILNRNDGSVVFESYGYLFVCKIIIKNLPLST